MFQPLSDDLFRRLQARAADSERRTDAPPSTRGRSVGGFGGFAIRGLDLGALLRGDADPHVRPSDAPLARPLNATAIADAEARLGFLLPDEVRQLYAGIADGGFGPGGGLLPLARVVEAYLELVANPPGWRKQPWPPRLLPLTWTDPGHECIDIGTGEMIYWDEEELAAGPSDKVWNRSFKQDAPSLAAWLETWVGKPSPEEAQRASMEAMMLDGVRQSLAHFRAMTPQQRRDYGLPDTGWEQELFGHLGIDLSRL